MERKDRMTQTTLWRRTLLSLTPVALLTPGLTGTSASAQQEPFQSGSQLVTGFTGPIFDLGGEPEDTEGQDVSGVEFESDWAFGGSYQYFLTPKLSVEASLVYGTGEGEIE